MHSIMSYLLCVLSSSTPFSLRQTQTHSLSTPSSSAVLNEDQDQESNEDYLRQFAHFFYQHKNFGQNGELTRTNVLPLADPSILSHLEVRVSFQQKTPTVVVGAVGRG